MAETIINRKLAKKILGKITSSPQAFNMEGWVDAPEGVDPAVPGFKPVLCGSTLCVAGWAQQIVRGYVNEETVEEDARDLLGLKDTELFYTSNTTAVHALQSIVSGCTQEHLDAIINDGFATEGDE